MSKTNPDMELSTMTLCMQSQCPKAGQCLRYQQFQRCNDEIIDHLLNPKHSHQEACTHFLPLKKVSFAWGFDNITRNMGRSDYSSFRLEAEEALYCSHTAYYHYQKGRWYLTPTQQLQIRKILQDKGIAQEEVFDKFTENYEIPY